MPYLVKVSSISTVGQQALGSSLVECWSLIARRTYYLLSIQSQSTTKWGLSFHFKWPKITHRHRLLHDYGFIKHLESIQESLIPYLEAKQNCFRVYDSRCLDLELLSPNIKLHRSVSSGHIAWLRFATSWLMLFQNQEAFAEHCDSMGNKIIQIVFNDHFNYWGIQNWIQWASWLPILFKMHI